MVDWNGKNRKALREAIEKAYPEPVVLKIFVSEELDENLAVVAGGDNLQVMAFSLIEWARAKNQLDNLFDVFKRDSPKADIAQIEQKHLIPQSFNLSRTDWESLFEYFQLDDSADLRRALYRGFKQTFENELQVILPKPPPLGEPAQIREFLETYDVNQEGATLVVRFVECAIAEIHRSNQKRDVTVLQQWRDRIAQQFNIPFLQPEEEIVRRAYLLVTLEESGPDVIVHPELHIDGQIGPVGFGVTPMTCSIDEVAEHISKWIHGAEKLLVAEKRDDVQVTLEIFLPCRYLGEDISTTWIVRNRRGEEVELGRHRWFLVRSTDRIRDPQAQVILRNKWHQLEACTDAGDPCRKFHQQDTCPETKRGTLKISLKEKVTGLKFLAQLPVDRDQQEILLYDIIDAAIPIALWTSETDQVDLGILATEFDRILAGSITNFAELASRWQSRRTASDVSKQIKILCDRPDRIPRLPDLAQREDDDAIVA
ncbi:MAG: hypothetical protein HC860_20630 [Alkalinema sp. RU_4_3]|nr:hypothetical protein [Alkalinema sp. RU_4_3]